VSGADGGFRLEGLRPGAYHLIVTLPGGGGTQRQTLELTTDQEIVIDLAVRRP
jgi:hypothetical protein